MKYNDRKVALKLDIQRAQDMDRELGDLHNLKFTL